jgi:DNA-binding NtrC family response regulator
VAKSDCSVLIEGETGSGKEQVAESLHLESPRKDAPFVVVDCGALSGELLESELFGHARGAFTGADSERKGLLQMADGGTVFLDEVGELPTALQVKLLGVLERRKVTPVGTSTARAIDVRVIAATNRNLARDVNEGRFRSDLFFRLAVVRLRVPPLRERLDDIPMLVEHFLEQLRQREGEHVPSVLQPIELARLSAQPWAGNVRELRNAVERLALRLGGEPAPEEVQNRAEPFMKARDRFVEEFEKHYLTDILERVGMNVSEAARQAGVDRRNFQRLLRRHQISPRELKRS